MSFSCCLPLLSLSSITFQSCNSHLLSFPLFSVLMCDAFLSSCSFAHRVGRNAPYRIVSNLTQESRSLLLWRRYFSRSAFNSFEQAGYAAQSVSIEQEKMYLSAGRMKNSKRHTGRLRSMRRRRIEEDVARVRIV